MTTQRMSFFEKRAELLNKSTLTDQLEYEKLCGHSTGEGDRYEEGTLALVFLRCLREGLRFALSSNDAAGDKFDDLVLYWENEECPKRSALFVQLKHKTATKNIRRRHLTKRSEDFFIGTYHDSYVKIRNSLEGGSYALVLSTNLDLAKGAQSMFVRRNPESVPGVKLLDSGGYLYSLNQDDDDVKSLVEGDDQFIQHFYLFCNQSNSKSIKDKIYTEIQLVLGADDNCRKTMCDNLCSCLREWMNTQNVCLTSDWKIWLDTVDTYVKEKVTSCNSLVTRIKYRCVEALEKHIRGCNPAWIRPPGQEATALSATKVHQAVCGEGHIMVSVARLRELQEKILCCWGPFCRWLVLVDDDEHSYDILHHTAQQVGPKRRLVIVSYKGDDSFLDTCQSRDVHDDSWNELIDCTVWLNTEQHSCHMKDLCSKEGLKAILDGKPEALVALSQLSGPVTLGQDLDPLPPNHIPRQLTSRMRVRQEFFSSHGDKKVCIMDEVSHKLLTNTCVLKNTITFEELGNCLSVSDNDWPLYVVTNDIDRSAVQTICSKYADIFVYILSYVDDGWLYVEEQSVSLLNIVDSLSNRVIVDGKPGVGKSTMLVDMARQLKGQNPSWWILRIDLLKYTEVFDSCDSGVEASKNILHRVLYNEKNLCELELSLLRHCLQEYPRTICMVDGFDEICPDYAGQCLEALEELAPRRGKLVVTTRPSVTGHLETALGVFAHSLPAFTEDQLLRFHGWPSSDTGVTDVVRDLLKYPLFSRMYADLLESENVVRDIVTLYEAFFERKFRRLFGEKCGNDLSKLMNKRTLQRERVKHEEQLGFLAVSLLLPRIEVPCRIQPSTTDRDDLVKAGVIYQFIDNKPVFIHRTFAEYFLAKWCYLDVADSLRANVYCRALCDSSLEFFVECFDRMASRGQPLLTAVLDCSDSEVKSLLSKGADPTEGDKWGRNALHLVSASSGDSTLLWLLVERLEVVGATMAGGSASGPAEEAREGVGAEDRLLQWTPLRYAAERGRWRAVAALLEVGAQLRHLGDFQRGLHSPEVLWRVYKEKGYIELFDHVLGKNESVRTWQRLEHRGNNKQCLDIEVGVSIVCAEMSAEQYGELMVLASNYLNDEVEKLIWRKLQDMEKKLTMVLCQGSSKTNKLPECRDVPLREADLASNQFQQLTTARSGDILCKESGELVLHSAAAIGNTERIRQLVQAGADVNLQNSRGLSAIHLAAIAGNVDCIKWLHSSDADINMKDEDGKTPLHHAAWMGRPQSVKLLLDIGADALVQDSECCTALHLAARKMNVECVRLLACAIKNLEVADLHGLTALHYAAQNGDDESVKHLLRAGAHNSPARDSLDTPLHLAALEGYAECVRQLVEAKADVGAGDTDGETPLHKAAMYGKRDCLEHLLRAGADMQKKDGVGFTPLHRAALNGSEACVRLLLEAGADVHTRDDSGHTALHYATLMGRAECVEILLAAGAEESVSEGTSDSDLTSSEEESDLS